jgi:membrane protein YdbS with pleckstrin-like domain
VIEITGYVCEVGEFGVMRNGDKARGVVIETESGEVKITGLEISECRRIAAHLTKKVTLRVEPGEGASL